jgi:DNA-binding NtrC family response regulator
VGENIEVLVLDDEPIVCERLQDYLRKKGMSVETFNDSRQALKRIGEKSFDVIITDLKMEGPTGMDILLAVREGSYNSEVIIITGYGSFTTFREAEAVGAFDFISKPFHMSEMYKLVKKAAEKSRKHYK